MKNHFIISCVLIFFCSLCLTGCVITSTLEPSSKQYLIEHGLTKDQAYKRSNIWMVETFNDAEHIIQYQDKEEGILVGRYLVTGYVNVQYLYGAPIESDYRVYAIIKIENKDGRSRLTIDQEGGTTTSSEEDVKEMINDLYVSYRTKLLQATTSDF